MLENYKLLTWTSDGRTSADMVGNSSSWILLGSLPQLQYIDITTSYFKTPLHKKHYR